MDLAALLGLAEPNGLGAKFLSLLGKRAMVPSHHG